MKKFLLICIAVLVANSAFSQVKSVFLNINHAIEKSQVVLNTQVYSAPNGVKYKLKRLQYYISDVSITHDGGEITKLNKVYLLVDPKTINYYLGDFEINTVENIDFKIGVDSLTNHGDPSLYPSGHPLAPQNPSMHWGWASGYRFAAIEGDSDSGNGQFADIFEFHTIGDDLYTAVSVKTGSEIKDGNLHITLNSDYNKLFNNINLFGGIIQHGNLSPNDILMANFKDVFTGTKLTSVFNPLSSFNINFQNPASNLYIQYKSSENQVDFSLFDVHGNKVMFLENLVGEGIISGNESLPSGLYIFNFGKKNKVFETGKIIINK